MKRTPETFRRHLETVVASCGTTWLLLYTDTLLGVEYLAVPSTCKSNYCPSCRKIHLRHLRAQLIRWMARKTWRLCTLTFPWRPVSPTEALRHAARTWRRFQRSLERKYPGILWVRTLEIHESGYPHFHMVVDRYIPQAHLATLWQRAGGGIVDIRMATDTKGRPRKAGHKQAAWYLTEEIEKTVQDPHRLGSELWCANIRTITTCRAIKLHKEPSAWHYLARKQTLEDLANFLRSRNFSARMADQPNFHVEALYDTTFLISQHITPHT